MAATRPPVTSHVLDTARYSDDARSAIRGTDIEQGDAWVRHVSHTFDDVVKWRVSEGDTNIGSDVTNADGRCPQLLDVGHKLIPGVYRCTFDTKAYFEATGQRGFFPEVAVMFEVESTAEHYHIPLLLSPFGYSTYRGS